MQNAKPAPIPSVTSAVGGIFTELGLLAAYAVMFLLTVFVVSVSALAYAVFAIPRALTQVNEGRAREPNPQHSDTALWRVSPSGGRR